MAEDDALRRRARTLGLAWLALIALMLASLGSATLPLGVFNLVAGLAIAALKAAVVVWLFMRLRDDGPLVRMAAIVGLGTWALLAGLGGLDYATRPVTPAAVQRPQALLPVAASSPQRLR
jgi:cytochrome c oxidase subunit 4